MLNFDKFKTMLHPDNKKYEQLHARASLAVASGYRIDQLKNN